MVITMNSLNIAFFADSHLGYRYANRTNTQGVNLRVVDGYKAFHTIIEQIITSDERIDAVVHGGDLFHTSHPSIRDIATAQHYLRELARAGIPFYGLAGNHDASDDRSLLAAVAVVDDPERNIHALWKPYSQHQIGDGVFLHSVAHHGLGHDEAPEVSPVVDGVNLFTTHGAALDPKNNTLMRCIDSPREQIVPPELVTADEFSVRLLGHYHSRYAVGGEALNTWYAGSSLRRGFSDAPGARGWLLVRIFPDGRTEVEARDIFQRPQHDFAPIDASGLTSAEIQEQIMANIGTALDVEAEAMDLDNAPILRQRVLNATRAKREGIDRSFLAKKAANALKWQLEFMRPSEEAIIQQMTPQGEEGHTHEGETTPEQVNAKKPRTIDLGGQYLEWVSSSRKMAALDPEQRAPVGEEAHRHIQTVENEDEGE